jgi:hypothetical protein
MARKLGTFMFHLRLIQLLTFFAIAFENGWLIVYIDYKKLGLAGRMAAIEGIVSGQAAAAKEPSLNTRTGWI